MTRGMGSLETILGLVFLLMLGATVFSVYQFMADQPKATASTELLATYHGLFERLRADCRAAVSARVGRDTLQLTGAGGQSLTYTLRDGSLIRQSGTEAAQTLLTGLHAGGFVEAESEPKLVSVWLIPADSFAPPFFTSFTLRGGAW